MNKCDKACKGCKHYRFDNIRQAKKCCKAFDLANHINVDRLQIQKDLNNNISPITNFVNEIINIGDEVIYLRDTRTGTSTIRKCKFTGLVLDFTHTGRVVIQPYDTTPDRFVPPNARIITPQSPDIAQIYADEIICTLKDNNNQKLQIKKIVFDIDDILWNLNERASSLANVYYDRLITYRIEDNYILSDEEKARMHDTYNRTDLFENINFNPGVEEINDLNADIYINSNVYSHDVTELKRQQLRKILNIPDDHYIFNLITPSTSQTPKRISSDTFIFVDDSPYNIIKSDAAYNIMIKKPWNISLQAMELYSKAHKNIIFCDDLYDVIDTIKQLLDGTYIES